MSYVWYEEAAVGSPLMQGDFIEGCPVVKFNQAVSAADQKGTEIEQLLTDIQSLDCVVMSQACDLEHGKVREVILCPSYLLSDYETAWKEGMELQGQNPTPKAWGKHLNEIRDGKVWNLSMLNERQGNGAALTTEIRIVDFHEIFTLPRGFLEAWVAKSNAPRLRLLPPYREHLSQAFARYFMRVGLPIEITPAW